MEQLQQVTTLRELRDYTLARLEKAGIAEPRRSMEWLVQDVVGCDRTTLYTSPERSVSAGQKVELEKKINRRVAGEPVQYIVGQVEFFGIELHVSPAVLIPRPETEELVEWTLVDLRRRENPRLLDVGTGSGCIALAIKNHFPDAEVWACDVSGEALEVAVHNAGRLGLDVRFKQADVLDEGFTGLFEPAFDLVVSNPPYIPLTEMDTLATEVVQFEPHVALFSGRDPLLFYHALSRNVMPLLNPGGTLLVETHSEYTRDVARLFERYGYVNVTVRTDLAGRDRMVYATHGGGSDLPAATSGMPR